MKTRLPFYHFHLWPTFHPRIPYGSLAPASSDPFPPPASIMQGTKNGMQGQTWDLAKAEKKTGGVRTLRGGDGEEERSCEEKEKCTLYFSNGWEMIRWDLLTIIRWGLINSDHSQRGEGWSSSTKEQTVGGRYLRKLWPGVSNMRQHSPPHTLHCSIWLLSELISWRIKANRRDPRARGCLCCTTLAPPCPQEWSWVTGSIVLGTWIATPLTYPVIQCSLMRLFARRNRIQPLTLESQNKPYRF